MHAFCVCWQDYSETREWIWIRAWIWIVACRQMSGHGRTDYILSPSGFQNRTAFSDIVEWLLREILRSIALE